MKVFMAQKFRNFWMAVGLVLPVGVAFGAAFLGPNNEAYQITENGYNPNDLDGLPTGPKNLGEEYRRVTPVMFYTFDQNFIDYFGTNGIDAIERAFEVFNGLTNVSSYSADLLEFPLEAQRVNYQAQALFLSDLKSATMSMIMEQLGAAQPDRYVWTLHARWHVGSVECPAGQNYLVVKRNFDPVTSSLDQLQASSYVNGTLFSYKIIEFCDPPTPFGWLADAVEFNVDPLATPFTAVASGFGSMPYLLGGTALTALGGLGEGYYYIGLTRDDVGALRYLMRSSNINLEGAGTNVLTYVTNTTAELLATEDLASFIENARVSDPGTLTALYPGLQIANSSSYFTNVITTNTVFYVTNVPFAPAGMAVLRSANVVTTNIQRHFYHEFLNAYITPEYQLTSNFEVPLVPGHTTTNYTINNVITNVSAEACPPMSPAGSICTNVTIQSEVFNSVGGDFYILPTNWCAVGNVQTQLVRTVTLEGESFTVTNAPGTINTNEISFTITPTLTYTQYIYQVYPVSCPEDWAGYRRGIERVQFVRRDYDSLIGQFYYPTNSEYTIVTVTNNQDYPQHIRREVFQPDILITAQDLTGGPGGPSGAGTLTRSIEFDSSRSLNGLAGPGTILNPAVIAFSKTGPVMGNSFPQMDEATGFPLFLWASYDGSTNPPVVYPNGTSVAELENHILIQVTPSGPDLPDAILGVEYGTIFGGFSVTGGTAPFTWTIAPASGGLPPGLTLDSSTGLISGVPTQPNIYDFTLRVTDAAVRSIDLHYTITVTP